MTEPIEKQIIHNLISCGECPYGQAPNGVFSCMYDLYAMPNDLPDPRPFKNRHSKYGHFCFPKPPPDWCPIRNNNVVLRIANESHVLSEHMIRQDGEPCSHPGCKSHISHPCEGCGRIAACGEYIPSSKNTFFQSEG